MPTKTRISPSKATLKAIGGFLDLRHSYLGVVQKNGQVLVAAMGAPVGTGVLVTLEEWKKWFVK